jgi:two-component system phosphate regulon sensor histidine kinase PhoR
MKKRKLFWRLFSNFMLVGSLGLITYFLIVVWYVYSGPFKGLEDKTEIYAFFIRNLGLTLVIMMAVMASVSIFLAKNISKPLVLLEEKTKEAIDSQEPKEFVFNDYQTDEVASLAKWIGELHSHFINRVKKVTTQKNEQEAIFMSLSEGVMAISSELKIKRMNTKAKKIFRLEERFKKDLALTEAIRQPELVEFVKEVMGNKEPAEMEMEILEPKRRNLKVNSAPYLNARSDQIGVVLIFSDITRLKKLEQHRIEFVANVSHELKTPLTSIQGYAETLLNPKMQSVPEKQIEFAEKIKDNSIRLRTMVEDLLYLANLDQHQGSSEEFKVREGDLSFQVKRAMEYLKAKAVSSSKSLVFEPNVEAKVRINEGLFMQALVNIIDNAIKYSGDSEKIWIKSFTNDEQKICLEIRDEGIGISKEDIGRLFERFYRVDKDRSRNTGGSGLGLAIVKNILDLHQIELKVESELGIGTRFSLIFPT